MSLNILNWLFYFSSENGETQNETPTESDKMDISEVSDKVSPVSEQVS